MNVKLGTGLIRIVSLIGTVKEGITMSLDELFYSYLGREVNTYYKYALGVVNGEYVLCKVPLERFHRATEYDIGYYTEKLKCPAVKPEFPFEYILGSGVITSTQKYLLNYAQSVDMYLEKCFPHAFLTFEGSDGGGNVYFWHRDIYMEELRYKIRSLQCYILEFEKTHDTIHDDWAFRQREKYLAQFKDLYYQYVHSGGNSISWDNNEVADLNLIKEILVK